MMMMVPAFLVAAPLDTPSRNSSQPHLDQKPYVCSCVCLSVFFFTGVCHAPAPVLLLLHYAYILLLFTAAVRALSVDGGGPVLCVGAVSPGTRDPRLEEFNICCVLCTYCTAYYLVTVCIVLRSMYQYNTDITDRVDSLDNCLLLYL